MTMSKRFGILVLGCAIGLFALELGGRLSIPGVLCRLDGPGRRRASAHTGQRGRGRTPHVAALRGRCLRLLRTHCLDDP